MSPAGRHRRCNRSHVTGPCPQARVDAPHAHLDSLGQYVRLDEETPTRVTAGAEPAARQRVPQGRKRNDLIDMNE